jgi:hypothetical protein
MRFMTLVKSAENMGLPPQALMDGIAQLGVEAGQVGVLVEMGGLLPSAMGARLRLSGGKITATDGPFAEAKEVIGGYAVYEVPSKADAMYWCERFLQLHKDTWPEFEGEVELRQVFTAADFA